ncbi:hypothetical protein FTO68_03830 [Methanocalculus taiwanensis]|uniref:DUF4430 domain-containing protein n=1 Tax=Methanocalculus taiwanensis TaxID=106207 RepID=A0ABD4TGM7_9EURY|nr:hypothetical protein [Methanocalculus taiwanensis]MCQ1538122.1 hypothetical protein [Methanocalculus taiwanensis]
MALLLLIMPAAGATTELHIVKYASDGETVLNETTKEYTWLETNLDVLGDGTTHYSLQGPVFEGDPWNPEEDTNLKDQGAVKGTDLADICDLVGGMSAGETVKVIADDTFSKTFPYSVVYNPATRQGPIGITWYLAGDGYVPDYSSGMKVIFFADDGVFGVNDMKQTFPEEYWYYYEPGIPTTTGLSVKYIEKIAIMSNEDAPEDEKETLFDDTLELQDETFPLEATSETSYDVGRLTPLGALDAAGLNLTVNDKSFATKGILLLDGIEEYLFSKADGTTWICNVNGQTLDDFGNYETEGLNVYQLNDGDVVECFFGVKPVTAENATAYVRIEVSVGAGASDTLFDDTLELQNETFPLEATSETSYDVERLTPLGALDAAGLNLTVNDKSFATKGILLLDGIEEYLYDKTAGTTWICNVNGQTLDDFGNYETEGLNIYQLNDGDVVECFFGVKPITPETATAYVRIEVSVDGGSAPGDWTLELDGALNELIHQSYFEQGIKCGHGATYEDDDGNVWSGMPLWWLVGYVDDGNKHGSEAFNDALAEQGYSIKVTAGDGYSINFQSAAVARNDNIIVANTLNGEPLPATIGEKEKPCFPLQMIGSDVSSGQKVGNVVKIELIGLPEPQTEWAISLDGAFKRTFTQSEFEEGVGCGHSNHWTDADDNVWTGMPLWYLIAVVDDINADNHWKFNNTRAADGYTVSVTAEDGYTRSFASADIARNNDYIIANKMNSAPLDDNYPLRLVGSALTSGGQRVGNIASISISGLPEEPQEGEWILTLKGRQITANISQSLFEEEAARNAVTYDDGVSVWTGIPLWRLAGLVDDDRMIGPDFFNEELAGIGYTVIVSSGGDSPYSKDFTSQEMAESKNNYIVANTVNGTAIPGDAFPLRLVGDGAKGSKSVGNIETIELTEFDTPTEAPAIRVVKYAADGVTIIQEVTKDYLWMKENLPVIGGENGVRLRFQGPTFDPDDLWNPDETKNPNKVDEVVRGTAIKDLCDLVGGAPEGSEIILKAKDGFKTTLNYTNLYSPLDRQGEAIVAWWTERQGYVPEYSDGYRNFFNTPDGIFGADDMRTTMKQDYWHYYWADGIQYPSAAGVSTKTIATIEIRTGTRENWELLLTGAISDTIDRAYFESAKSCAMAGQSHHATWTDGDDEWSGLPLWTLVGWVDDENKHDFGSNPFRDDLAELGYNITVIDYGPDGTKGTDDDFSATFHSTVVARNQNIIVANELNGQPLPSDGEKPTWPLRLVGSDLTSGKQRVGSIDEIALTDLPAEIDADDIIQLKEGWNFISVPKRLSIGNNTAQIFSSVDTMDRSIWEYNSALKLWKALKLTDVVLPLNGFWIYSAEDCEIALQYDDNPVQTPPTRELNKGWNAIGFSGLEPASARDTLLSLGDLWTQAIGYDPVNQKYETAIIRGGSGSFSDTQEMYPTHGYWIYLTGNGELASL